MSAIHCLFLKLVHIELDGDVSPLQRGLAHIKPEGISWESASGLVQWSGPL